MNKKHRAPLTKILLPIIALTAWGCDKKSTSFEGDVCSGTSIAYGYQNTSEQEVFRRQQDGLWVSYSAPNGNIDEKSAVELPIADKGEVYLPNVIYIPPSIDNRYYKKNEMSCEYSTNNDIDWDVVCTNEINRARNTALYNKNRGILKITMSCEDCPASTLLLISEYGIGSNKFDKMCGM